MKRRILIVMSFLMAWCFNSIAQEELSFSGDIIIPVKSPGKGGYYINTKGELLFGRKFDRIGFFDEYGIAEVVENGLTSYINTKGEVIGQVVGAVENYGFKDKDGKLVIPCKYHKVKYITDDLILVLQNQKLGGFDIHGNVVFDFIYDGDTGFYRGSLTTVKIGKKKGLINKKGKLVTPCIYDSIDRFYEEGLALVNKDGKIGYLNTKGELVIPCIFDIFEGYEEYEGYSDFVNCEAPPPELFSGNTACVNYNGKPGIIDIDSGYWCELNHPNNKIYCVQGECNKSEVSTQPKLNKIAPPHIYRNVGEFIDGYAAAQLDPQYSISSDSEGKWGRIDINGNIVTPFIYDWIEVHENGNFLAGKTDKSKKGSYDTTVIEYDCGLALVSKNGKLGFINKQGEIVIPCIYDPLKTVMDDVFEHEAVDLCGIDIWFYRFKHGITAVAKDGKVLIINTTGKVIVPDYPIGEWVWDWCTHPYITFTEK